jgi:hypothetical protein
VALIDSGGKSIHGRIQIDATGTDDWSRSVEDELFDLLTAAGEHHANRTHPPRVLLSAFIGRAALLVNGSHANTLGGRLSGKLFSGNQKRVASPANLTN